MSDNAEQQTIIRNSAVMALGTVFSRLSGLIRGILLAAILGASLHLEIFQIANTIPTILYIVVAGGVFNAVLVPQLVRTAKEDSDGGAAYLNRVITLALVFLSVATVALVIAAPVLMDRVYLSSDYQTPELAAHRDSAVALARWCLPQVFFYGMFTLVGQVLNSRDKFGPMMWAPIANNAVAIVALLGYWAAFGTATGATARAAYTTTQEVALGLGATAGIVIQLLILVPYLKAAGVRYRPRWDWRNAGISHTLRLGGWTAGFVIVNQIALAVVVNLASSGPAASAEGTGYGVYSLTYPLMILPHSIVTVSLTAAILPLLSRKAADGDLAGLSGTLFATVRRALAVVLPVAILLPVLAPELARAIFGIGASAQSVDLFVPAIALWSLAVPFFTMHYLMLRGFYALEDTRRVFFIQCVIAATNIGAALVLTSIASPKNTVPALIGAYTLSYVVGSALSVLALRRRLGRGEKGDPGYLGKLLGSLAVTAIVAIMVMAALRWALPTTWSSSVASVITTALAAALIYLGAARVVGLGEVNDVMATLLRRGRRSGPAA